MTLQEIAEWLSDNPTLRTYSLERRIKKMESFAECNKRVLRAAKKLREDLKEFYKAIDVVKAIDPDDDGFGAMVVHGYEAMLQSILEADDEEFDEMFSYYLEYTDVLEEMEGKELDSEIDRIKKELRTVSPEDVGRSSN